MRRSPHRPHVTLGLLSLAFVALALQACGLCGTEKLVDKARSPKVMAFNEMSDTQQKAVTDLGLTKDKEAVIWFYDQSLTGSGEDANVLTTKRVVSIQGGKTYEVKFNEIKSVEHDVGGTSERIRVEKESGEFVVLKFGVLADSKRMYESLCSKVEGKCGDTP